MNVRQKNFLTQQNLQLTSLMICLKISKNYHCIRFVPQYQDSRHPAMYSLISLIIWLKISNKSQLDWICLNTRTFNIPWFAINVLNNISQNCKWFTFDWIIYYQLGILLEFEIYFNIYICNRRNAHRFIS